VLLDDDEPRIQDEELGTRLGYERLATIRDLVKRLIRTKKLKNVRCVRAVRTQSTGLGRSRNRAIDEFWLTKKQALKVILKAETDLADQVQDEMIDVFDAVMGGQFVPRWVAVPVPQNSLTLGDLHEADIKERCKKTADRIGTSAHQVQGWLKMLYGASGVYKISAAHYSPVIKLLGRWSNGTAPTPSKPRRLLKAATPRPPQCDLPFPEPETIQ
jgi:hypothetical protein